MSQTRTPRKLYPKLTEFCERLVPGCTPAWVPVLPVQGGQQSFCFPLVAAQVEQHGGESVTGWQVWEWPGVYLEAEYHAVWRNPEGALVDLTPKDVPTKKILFLADPNRPYEGRRRRNEMSRLADHEAISDFIEACNESSDMLNLGDRAFQDEISLGPLEKARYDDLTRVKGMAILWIEKFGEPTKFSPCWCGSGRAYKSCHLGQK